VKRLNREEEKIPGRDFQKEKAKNSSAHLMKTEINKTGTAHLYGKGMKSVAG
jgi:hypothetical protein